MFRRLTVCLLLGLGVIPAGYAQKALQTSTASSWNSLPTTPDDRDAALALKAPAFAGLWVNGPKVVLAVTSSDPAQRQQVVEAVRAQRGTDLKSSGHDLKQVSFVMVKYNAAQLSRLRYLARGLQGWNSVGVDVKENKLRIEFQLPQYRDAAAQFFASKGVPADALLLVAPTPPALPDRTTRKDPLSARMVIPAKVAQGDLLPMQFLVTNKGNKPLYLDLVCSFHYEVVRASTGEVVKPVPAPGACPSIAAGITIKPGETGDALMPVWASNAPANWNLKDLNGKVVPPGKYLLRAVHGSGQYAIRAPDVTFTVLPRAADGGVQPTLELLTPLGTVDSIKVTSQFVIQNGVQRLVITAPDQRAKQAIEALARKKGVALSRVTINVSLPKPVPVPGKPGEAELKVHSASIPSGALFDISLKLKNPAASQKLPGAVQCQFVTVVRRVKDNDIAFASSTFPNSRANHCPTGASLHLPLSSQWDGRLSDGRLAPAGKYEILAGLRILQTGGKVNWLSAPAYRFDWDGGSCSPVYCAEGK